MLLISEESPEVCPLEPVLHPESNSFPSLRKVCWGLGLRTLGRGQPWLQGSFFSQALAVPCVGIPELEQATARLLPLPGAVDREDEQSKEEKDTEEGGEEINPGNMIDGV